MFRTKDAGGIAGLRRLMLRQCACGPCTVLLGTPSLSRSHNGMSGVKRHRKITESGNYHRPGHPLPLLCRVVDFASHCCACADIQLI
ncbi:hypothetical protein IEO21_06882 [Rhodonia placenta]|uniref:Uncharacterized protein n=2 Tax=Rhodonia placenta TaxID=104341 RepID=A0A1X6MLZ8_9APHY|nr:hypothetical protein POSPLADRAFT_1041696 [Postia placenta MAD-698-R-SB12]KAF9810521.1 hypothetical protein IEO21_06882 [Postia placenta]OSX57093.1 hypothetical protein POSPLADRAFT_1041696 [Postia placenta MAD-698-R-SB12]